MYIVKSHASMLKAVRPLINKLKMEHSNFPRTVIYCRKLSDCGILYLIFKEYLGEKFIHLSDAPDIPQFRVVDMYHSSTDPVVKENILKNFCQPS